MAWSTPPIANKPTTQTIRMLTICPTAAVTVQRADGTLRQRVALTRVWEGPDSWGTYGDFAAPVRNGVGTWLITHIHDGANTRKLAKPKTFVVQRATVIPMRRIGWSSAGKPFSLSATAWVYTSTGKPIPLTRTKIEVLGRARDGSPINHRLALLSTDSAGRFRFTNRFPEEYQLSFNVRSANPLIASSDTVREVLFHPGVLITSRSRPVVGVPMTINGYAGPGVRTLGITIAHETGGYTDTGIRATSRADGTFTIRYTPTSTDYQRLFVATPPGTKWSADPYDQGDLEIYPGKPPVKLTGITTLTEDAVARPGSKLSSYGHLRLTDGAAASAPYGGKSVLVQMRPKSTPTAPYKTVATATTTRTGYYYVNWRASVDADIRVAHVSARADIPSAFTYVRSLDVR